MDPRTLAIYRELRADGRPASMALRGARGMARAERARVFRRDGEARVRWSQGGYDLEARLEDDEDGLAREDLGRYTDRKGPGSLDNENHRFQGGRVYRYFQPTMDYAEARASLRHDHTRHDAHTMARDWGIQQKRTLDSGLCLEASVSCARHGVTLATEYLGGIEVESLRDTYLDEVLDELVSEALGEGGRALGLLRAG